VNDDVRHYSMLIEWRDEDLAYIVTVPGLPGCKTHGSTYEAAVRRGQDAIETWIDAMRSWGRPVPPPRVVPPHHPRVRPLRPPSLLRHPCLLDFPAQSLTCDPWHEARPYTHGWKRPSPPHSGRT